MQAANERSRLILERVSEEPHKTIAIIEGDKVVYIHELFKKTIDIHGGVTIPSIGMYIEKFGSTVVHPTHAKYAEAVKIFLDFDVVAKHPKSYVWKTEKIA